MGNASPLGDLFSIIYSYKHTLLHVRMKMSDLIDIDSELFHYTQQSGEQLPLFTTPTLMKRLRNGRGVEISDSHSLMAIS